MPIPREPCIPAKTESTLSVDVTGIETQISRMGSWRTFVHAIGAHSTPLGLVKQRISLSGNNGRGMVSSANAKNRSENEIWTGI
jgi:hypothetical protein